MHPYLWDHVRAYPAFIVLGIGTGMLVASVSARRTGIDWKPYLYLQITFAVAGIVGAKIYAVIDRGTGASLPWELASLNFHAWPLA